jgi:V-type H+-transporting ATPase subunit G
VKEIKDIGEKTGSKVVDQLLKAVTDVKPEPPRGRE